MKSSFLPTGAGYVYRIGDHYDPDLLTIEVTNVRQRAGSVYALLTTSTTIPGARLIPGTERVLNAEVWLLNERSRSEYAASLDRLIPAPEGAQRLNFGAVLEEMAQRVIEVENAPVSVVRLKPVNRQATPYLLEGLVPMRKPTILYGAGGTGKSILAAAIAVAVQTGAQFLGLHARQAEVLYLDWETDEEDLAGRVGAAARGVGVAEPAIRYSAMVRPLEDRVAALARMVKEEKIGLVIIDSVGMAMSAGSGNGDANETAIRFFRALRSLDAAVLAIDHVSGDDMRRGRAGASKPYGSVYKWNSARNAFELRTARDPDMDGVHLLLKHRKTNIGHHYPDLPILLHWDDTTSTARFTREMYVKPVLVPVEDQIRDVLLTGPATPAQIADMLSEGEKAYSELDVRRVLKQMLGKSEVSAGSDGTIHLADAGEDQVESQMRLDSPE